MTRKGGKGTRLTASAFSGDVLRSIWGGSWMVPGKGYCPVAPDIESLSDAITSAQPTPSQSDYKAARVAQLLRNIAGQ